MDNDFVYVTYIETTPAKLWEALTNPEFTRQYWFDIAVTSDWKVGSSMTYVQRGRTVVDGKILVDERPNRMVYTFREVHTEAAAEPPTRVTFDVEPVPGKRSVKLTVTHGSFVPNSKHRPSISEGWPLVLSGLKTLLETGHRLDTITIDG